jgi:hypothetical protein
VDREPEEEEEAADDEVICDAYLEKKKKKKQLKVAKKRAKKKRKERCQLRLILVLSTFGTCPGVGDERLFFGSHFLQTRAPFPSFPWTLEQSRCSRWGWLPPPQSRSESLSGKPSPALSFPSSVPQFCQPPSCQAIKSNASWASAPTNKVFKSKEKNN